MRFRAVKASDGYFDTTTMQIWLCICWIVLSSQNLHKDLQRHHTGSAIFHISALTIFVAALSVHLYLFFYGSITLDDDSMVIRQSFRPLTLPYSAIVGAQLAFSGTGKMLPHVVELEIARLAPDVYPHEYRKVRLSDPGAFLRALRPHMR